MKSDLSVVDPAWSLRDIRDVRSHMMELNIYLYCIDIYYGLVLKVDVSICYDNCSRS